MEPPSPIQALRVNLSRVDLQIERFPEEVSRADRGRANENREMTVVLSYVKQQAASALQKKVVLFINLLGKWLTQEINGNGSSS